MHSDKLKTNNKKRGEKKRKKKEIWPKIYRAWIQHDPTAKTHPISADGSWRLWSTCPKTSLHCHEEPQWRGEDLTASVPHPLHHTQVTLATSPGHTRVGASEYVGESVCLCSLCIRQRECIKINSFFFFFGNKYHFSCPYNLTLSFIALTSLQRFPNVHFWKQ